jgi:acyl carrier protein
MKDTIRALVGAYAQLTVALESLGDGDDLFAAGMTSLTSVNLMLALEDQFDVEFPNEMLNRATFTSIDAIAAAIDSLVPAK